MDCLREREKRPQEKKKSATTKCQKYSINSNKDTLYLHNDFLPKNSWWYTFFLNEDNFLKKISQCRVSLNHSWKVYICAVFPK